MHDAATDFSDLDHRLVRASQAGLARVSRPYAVLAEELGVSEALVCARLAAMLADGRIRRIGAVPNHYALGYQANGMSVWDIDDACVDEIGAEVGRLPNVSHCYRRPRRLPLWRYTLFAMVHARSRVEAEAQVEEIAAFIRARVGDGLRAHEVLFSSAILKKTGLRLRD